MNCNFSHEKANIFQIFLHSVILIPYECSFGVSNLERPVLVEQCVQEHHWQDWSHPVGALPLEQPRTLHQGLVSLGDSVHGAGEGSPLSGHVFPRV